MIKGERIYGWKGDLRKDVYGGNDLYGVGGKIRFMIGWEED